MEKVCEKGTWHLKTDISNPRFRRTRPISGDANGRGVQRVLHQGRSRREDTSVNAPPIPGPKHRRGGHSAQAHAHTPCAATCRPGGHIFTRRLRRASDKTSMGSFTSLASSRLLMFPLQFDTLRLGKDENLQGRGAAKPTAPFSSSHPTPTCQMMSVIFAPSFEVSSQLPS